MYLRLLVISDIHGETENLELLKEKIEELKVNVVICCGDIESSEAIELLSNFGVLTYAIPGNMDDFYIVQMLEEYGISLHGKVANLRDYIAVGIGGYKPITTLERLLRECSNELKKYDKIILVTHHPPYGTKVDIAHGGLHIGIKEFNDFIKEFKPKLCLCGHVHESPGVDKINNTIIVNPGPLMYSRYALVTLEKDKIDVELKKL